MIHQCAARGRPTRCSDLGFTLPRGHLERISKVLCIAIDFAHLGHLFLPTWCRVDASLRSTQSKQCELVKLGSAALLTCAKDMQRTATFLPDGLGLTQGVSLRWALP